MIEETFRQRERSLFLEAVRRFVRRKIALFGLIVTVLLVLSAVFASLIAPYDPTELAGPPYTRPNEKYLFGTDNLGRDVFSRIVYGTRVSLVVGAGAQGMSAVIGVILGLIAGYFGNRVDDLITRVVDVFMAFPFLLLAILMMVALGPSLVNVIIALGFSGWPWTCRITRAQALSLREQPFIEAARSIGAGSGRIMFRHILPNAFSPVLVVTTMGIAGAIIGEASLSFLGLGVQPPTPSWGIMLALARDNIFSGSYLSLPPGAAIFIAVLAFNSLGDGLRDALDPRMTQIQRLEI